MGLLYRGVCDELDQANEGKLRPTGGESTLTMRRDGQVKRRDMNLGLDRQGPSEKNAVRLHQHQSGMYGGCYLSFTRLMDKARRFATIGLEGQRSSGFVYVVNDELLAAHGVASFDVPDPLHPSEREVTLKAENNGDLPPEIIEEKIRVEANDA